MSRNFDASIVIPTFREHDNLQRLLPTLFGILHQAGRAAEVVVVDDDSRDGTESLCRRLSADLPLRLYVRRGERGLATAVLRGLQLASGNVLVVMDADFSHPPEAVPALIAAAESPQCELAIGSRYVAGGALDPNWSWFRRVNSKVAGLLARGLTDASDPMAGFFAIRRDTLARAKTLRPLGYKVLLELIIRCNCRQVVEIPITFQDREVGESKLSLAQQWLYLRHLARLYAARYLGPQPATTPILPAEPTTAPPKRRAA
jgi:dolichol-phosphate mannosyltransferase